MPADTPGRGRTRHPDGQARSSVRFAEPAHQLHRISCPAAPSSKACAGRARSWSVCSASWAWGARASLSSEEYPGARSESTSWSEPPPRVRALPDRPCGILWVRPLGRRQGPPRRGTRDVRPERTAACPSFLRFGFDHEPEVFPAKRLDPADHVHYGSVHDLTIRSQKYRPSPRSVPDLRELRVELTHGHPTSV